MNQSCPGAASAKRRGDTFRLIGATCFLSVLLGAAGCRRSTDAGHGVRIATTTSYLEAAARDLLGDNVEVLRLAEPGSCPGHFDIRPSHVTQIRRCEVLLRFDFQKALDAKLTGGGTSDLRVAEIALPDGMGRPDTYLTACRQAADHFVRLALLPRADADARLEAIATRLEALARDATNRVAQTGLLGSPALASGRQRALCEWLGLRVVGDFRAADTASVGEIEDAIAAGDLAQVRLVVANLPEGRRTADALAQRLRARVVVFENFPTLAGGEVSFDAMLARNLAALLESTVTPGCD